MNESSAYIWKKVQQMESFTADDLAQLLTEQYEVEYEVALKDATTLADQWVEAGIVEL
jgi:hypothetical protein